MYQNSFTLAATLDTDIHHSKHCINLALPTLVPVLNSPVMLSVYRHDVTGTLANPSYTPGWRKNTSKGSTKSSDCYVVNC